MVFAIQTLNYIVLFIPVPCNFNCGIDLSFKLFAILHEAYLILKILVVKIHYFAFKSIIDCTFLSKIKIDC